MAKSKQSQTDKKAQTAGNVSQAADNAGAIAGAGSANSAIETLKQDHRRVEKLFEQFEQSDDDREKERLVERICSELIIHTRLEEELFYPACRDADVEDDIMDEAQVEHDGAKVLVNDLLESGSDTPYWEAKVSVLKEMIKHHVEEEEKPDGVMERAKENGIDDSHLVERLRRRKQDLQERGIGRRPARPVSIDLELQARMGRRGRPERDERGRFMSDDESRYGGRSFRYEDAGGMRGRGGWYGNHEGHADAARERWDEGGRGLRHEGGYEDRWSSRGRDQEEYDDERSRRHGGWFGDARGHAAATRQGWEERHGTEGDRRYERSRHDEDDDRHSGWFGDSRGHAEASRRGWQHRR